MRRELEKLENEYPSRSGPFSAYGGKSLHAQSHGESFLAFLMHRPRGHGVYIFDEPEAALSPHRQMAVLARREPIAEVVAHADTDAALRARLEYVQAARTFACRLWEDS